MRISDWRSDVCSSDLLDPRVWLGTMVAVGVGDQRTPHPQIGFRLFLGFVEVVQRLLHLVHRAARPLDLALGAGRGVPVFGLRRQRIGRASRGEREGPYVEISVADVF